MESPLVFRTELPAVGADDPVCHRQTETVGSAGQSLQIFQHVGGTSLPVVRYGDRNLFGLRAAGYFDPAAVFVVVYTVLQQVVESSREKRFIAHDHRLSAAES